MGREPSRAREGLVIDKPEKKVAASLLLGCSLSHLDGNKLYSSQVLDIPWVQASEGKLDP